LRHLNAQGVVGKTNPLLPTDTLKMGGDDVSRVYSDKKVAYVERLEGYLANLPRVLLINADNVGSQQMHIVRAELRKDGQKAEILMGKNTMMKFVIRRAANNKPVYVVCSFDRSCVLVL